MNTKTANKFEKDLDEKLVLLYQCQQNKKVQSCSACQIYLKCDVRNQYISSVYNSMSKGQTGGFQF